MGKRGRPRHGSQGDGPPKRSRARGADPTGPGDEAYGDSGARGGPQETVGHGGRRSARAATGRRAERRRQARRIKRRRQRSYLKEIPILVGVALAIALVLKTFLVQAFVIPSGSMEQTIKIGDRVLVDKLTPWFGSKPERGDVVVFKDPGAGSRASRPSPLRRGRLPAGHGRHDLHRAAAVGR